MVLSGAVFGFWIYGWLTVIYTLNLWFGAAVVFTISNGIIWAADHFLDPPSLDWHFHTTLTFAYWLGAFTAYGAILLLNIPRLLNILSIEYDEKKYSSEDWGIKRKTWRAFLTPRAFWTLMFVISAILLTAAINWLVGRFQPQLGLDQSLANIYGGISLAIALLLLIAAIVLLILETWPGTFKKPKGQGITNLKGLIGLAAGASTMYFYDAFLINPGRPAQGFIHLAAVLVAYLIVWLILFFIPSPDPFYKNISLSLTFIAIVGGAHFFASIVGFATDELSGQNISAVFWAMLVYSIILILIFILLYVFGFGFRFRKEVLTKQKKKKKTRSSFVNHSAESLF